jgi:hypothetical protein
VTNFLFLAFASRLSVHSRVESLFRVTDVGENLDQMQAMIVTAVAKVTLCISATCGKYKKYFAYLQLHKLPYIYPGNLPQHSCVIHGKTYRTGTFARCSFTKNISQEFTAQYTNII